MKHFYILFNRVSLAALGAVLLLPSAGLAQQREALDALFYPQAATRAITYPKQQQVYVQLSESELKTVLLHYLKLGKSADWQMRFPTGLEAEIWLKSLDKRESPVFMLSLYNLKSKINFNLTLGAIEKTSVSKARSIITIYKMRHSFGRRGG